MTSLLDKLKSKPVTNEAGSPPLVAPLADVTSGSVQAPAPQGYRAEGVRQAGACDGHCDNLKPCLQGTHGRRRQEIAANEALMDERRKGICAKIAAYEGDIDAWEISLKNEEGKLLSEKEKIEALQSEMRQITTGKLDVGFWIGTFIITLLTLFLFMFYSSTAYTMFCSGAKVENVGTAIFNPNAFKSAWGEGVGELILILSIPAIFLGLGYLIHKFSEQRGWSRWLKILVLVFVTLAFDCILAFGVTHAVYEENKTFIQPPMEINWEGVKLALKQIEFLIVIFCGFVTYIIWGLLFNFVMEEYQKARDPRHAKNNLKIAIGIHETKCRAIQTAIVGLQQDIARAISDKSYLVGTLQQGALITFGDVQPALADFFAGWNNYMTNAGKGGADISQCTHIYNNYMAELQSAVYVRPVVSANNNQSSNQ